jgi:iron(III) transport system ATP-binding protein
MALADLVAVMEAGRFAQVAPPEEIYTRPNNAHVARFIGRSAILPVTLTNIDGAWAQTTLGGVPITVACRVGTKPGDALLVVRPEDVEIAPDGIPATVRSVSYRGGAWEALMDAGLPQPLPVTSRTRMRPGDAMTVRVTGGWVLPAA